MAGGVGFGVLHRHGKDTLESIALQRLVVQWYMRTKPRACDSWSVSFIDRYRQLIYP